MRDSLRIDDQSVIYRHLPQLPLVPLSPASSLLLCMPNKVTTCGQHDCKKATNKSMLPVVPRIVDRSTDAPINRSNDDHYEPHIEQVAYTSATWFGIDWGISLSVCLAICLSPDLSVSLSLDLSLSLSVPLQAVHSSVCLQSQRIPWNCLAFKRSSILQYD